MFNNYGPCFLSNWGPHTYGILIMWFTVDIHMDAQEIGGCFQVRHAQEVGNETRNPRPTGSACAQWAPRWAGFFSAGPLFPARSSQCWGGTPHPLAFSRSAETAREPGWSGCGWERGGRSEPRLGEGGGERAVVVPGDLEPTSLPGWEYLARERVAGTKGLPCE